MLRTGETMLNGIYDCRSTYEREYWRDDHCYATHPGFLVDAAADVQPHAVKPFGSYPEVPAQPGALLITEIGAQCAVRIVDEILDKQRRQNSE